MPHFAEKADFEINFMPFSLYPDLPRNIATEDAPDKKEYLEPSPPKQTPPLSLDQDTLQIPGGLVRAGKRP